MILLIVTSFLFVLNLIFLWIGIKKSPNRSFRKTHIAVSLLFFLVYIAYTQASSFLNSFAYANQYYDVFRSCCFFCVILMITFLISSITVITRTLRAKKNDKDMSSISYFEVLSSKLKFMDNSLPQILKSNNKDSRNYIKRLGLWIIPAITLSYMIFIFGVYEPFFSNLNEWLFTFSDICSSSILFFGGSVAIACIIPLFIKGKNLTISTVMLSIFTITSYIQNSFLNTNGYIDGTIHEQPDILLLMDILIWFIIPPTLIVILRKKHFILCKVLPLMCGALLLIQLSPLPFLLINGLEAEHNKPETQYVLDGSEQFTVSKEANTIVFIMDTYENNYFTEYLESHPNYKSILSDFIFFDNVNTEMFYTAFSMPSLLTAHDVDFSKSLPDSNKEAWSSSEAEYFYDSMHKANYKIKFYTDSAKYSGGAENMLGKIDNVVLATISHKTSPLPTYLSLVSLSLYRYCPYLIKAPFYVSDSKEINANTYSSSESTAISSDAWEDFSNSSKYRGIAYYNYDYYAELKKGLQMTESENQLIIQHIHGMHQPYISLEETEGDVDQDEAQNGCLTILTEYISQLNALGIYDRATIIVTADHGEHSLHDSNPIMLIKPAGNTSDSLSLNSCPGNLQSDLLPTILDCADLPYTQLGISLFSIAENTNRERICRAFYHSDDFPEVPKSEAVGNSIYNCYNEYHYYGRTADIDIENTAHYCLPITDYWW